MKNQRNVEGLRQNAQKKRQESFDKVDRGIKEMIRTRQRINFNTVAAACGVSKAFLYKEAEIKDRIEHLRQQSTETVRVAPEQRPSESSKDSLIKTLRERVKILSDKVKELEYQNATVYGKIVQMSEIEAENRKLKAQLAAAQSTPVTPINLNIVEPTTKVTSLADKRNVSDQISKELDELGIKLNSTLSKVVRSAPDSVVMKAIAALKDQLTRSEVTNPGGWLAKAIEGEWTVAEPINPSQPPQREIFTVSVESNPTTKLVSLDKLKTLNNIFQNDD
jgi:Family of unknown function (DUF6262)